MIILNILGIQTGFEKHFKNFVNFNHIWDFVKLWKQRF